MKLRVGTRLNNWLWHNKQSVLLTLKLSQDGNYKSRGDTEEVIDEQ